MTCKFENDGTLRKMTAEELAAADIHSSVIELDHGTLVNGRPYWAYIAVKPSKYKEYKRLTSEHKTITLNDYGQILKYGYDKRVPDSVKEEMQREYGCNDNYLTTLADDLKAEQSIFLKKREDMRIGDIVGMLKKQKPNCG